MELTIRAVNRMGDAFGIVDQDIRRAVDSVLDLIRVLRTAGSTAGAISLGGVLGIVGAGIGFISSIIGLVGKGKEEDPAAKRARENALEASRANTLAIEQLRRSFDKSLAVLRELTGVEIAERCILDPALEE